jgi:hypothetical protein
MPLILRAQKRLTILTCVKKSNVTISTVVAGNWRTLKDLCYDYVSRGNNPHVRKKG